MSLKVLSGWITLPREKYCKGQKGHQACPCTGFFSGCMPLLSHSLFIKKKKTLYTFLQRTETVFPILALVVEFCLGIVTAEALEVVRVLSQAKNSVKLFRFQRVIFQAAPQVLVGVCPVGLWNGWCEEDSGYHVSCKYMYENYAGAWPWVTGMYVCK